MSFAVTAVAGAVIGGLTASESAKAQNKRAAANAREQVASNYRNYEVTKGQIINQSKEIHREIGWKMTDAELEEARAKANEVAVAADRGYVGRLATRLNEDIDRKGKLVQDSLKQKAESSVVNTMSSFDEATYNYMNMNTQAKINLRNQSLSGTETFAKVTSGAIMGASTGMSIGRAFK